jgi:hypothetical protein
LDAKQSARTAIAGKARRDRVTAGIVRLVVVSLARDADWVVSGGGGFAVAQTGAGGGRFEDLDSMGPRLPAHWPPSAFSLPTRPLFVGCVDRHRRRRSSVTRFSQVLSLRAGRTSLVGIPTAQASCS